MKKWETKQSQKLIDNQWIKVYKDSVSLPNGSYIDDFYVVTLHDASAIVALDDNENIILKTEYRYCYDKELIEIPAGMFEQDEKDPLAVAKRELLEETGYISDDWTYLGSTIESSSKLTNTMHLYFANHCYKISDQQLDETEELDLMILPFDKVIEMVMNNEICCNSSANAILRVARILKK